MSTRKPLVGGVAVSELGVVFASKRAKKQFSSSASEASVGGCGAAALVVSDVPCHTCLGLLSEKWFSIFLL